MNEPDLFDALRAEGIDADDPEVRAAVRAVSGYSNDAMTRLGTHRGRRCMEAMHAALTYALQHPDVGDMSSFEADFDGDI